MIDSIQYSGLYIGISNGQLYVMGGADGSVIFVYGINFESSKNEFSYELSILEEARGGEIKALPIYLYPDKSCNFDLKTGFQYPANGKLHSIYCRKKYGKAYGAFGYIRLYNLPV